MARRAVLVAAAAALWGCALREPSLPPVFDHIVIVVEENKSAAQVLDSPYIASLVDRGTLLTHSYGVARPSQPNYLALFAGSTFGVTDNLNHDLDEPNLYTSLVDAGLDLVCYSEDLPSVGFEGAESGAYRRKHNPCASFTNVPPEANRPFSDFPTDFDDLPTVALVVPNQDNDMHDGTVEEGDAWLEANIDAYARWAAENNSLLVLTFDEPDTLSFLWASPVATILVGQRVAAGTFDQRVNHYSLLRMVEEAYDLPLLGESATATRIEGIWVWIPTAP